MHRPSPAERASRQRTVLLAAEGLETRFATPIVATLLVLFSVLTIHLAVGASTADRPAGVEERNWIPLSAKIRVRCVDPPHISAARNGQATAPACASGRRLFHGAYGQRMAAPGSALPAKTPEGTGYHGLILKVAVFVP
jgi:hypothetical protein